MTHFLDGTEEDRPGLAAGLMLSSLFMLALQDALARLAGEHVSFWQFQALRASCNVLFLTSFAFVVLRGLPPRPRRPWAVAARVVAMVMATVFFFGGIPKVTIVEMAAGLYTYPIFVTILSALFLGEKVGLRRLSAVLVGAAGAMLILQPGGEDFEWIKLMPIGAGLAYGCNVIITRRWCRGENAVTMAMAIASTFVVIGTAGCVLLAYYPTPQAFQETFPYFAFGWREAAAWVFGATVLWHQVEKSCRAAADPECNAWRFPRPYRRCLPAAGPASQGDRRNRRQRTAAGPADRQCRLLDSALQLDRETWPRRPVFRGENRLAQH